VILEKKIFDWDQPINDLQADYNDYVTANENDEHALMENDFLALESWLYKMDAL
jgi:hypothetical protein